MLDRPDTDAVVQMDADFSHDPRDLPRLLAPLMVGADLTLGTRYMSGGGTIGWPWYRRVISRGGTTFARTVLLLPYRDLTGGFKAWRRELLESIRLRDMDVNGYGFQVETTWWAHRRGARIVPVPITFRERTAGRSKMSGAIVREAMLRVLALRWRTLPFMGRLALGLGKRDSSFFTDGVSAAFSLLYAMNTFGAALGSALICMWFL